MTARSVLVLGVLALAAGPATAAGHPGDLLDSDHDLVRNQADNCPVRFNPGQLDTDGDTPEPLIDQPGPPASGDLRVYGFTEGLGLPTDRPPDAGGDSCDDDDDGDGVKDRVDGCRLDADPGQEDRDGDGAGDACDPDGLDPPAAAAADSVGPRLGVRLARRLRAEEVTSGLVIGVRCSEACALVAEARSRRRAVGRGGAHLAGEGLTFAFVDFRRGFLRSVRRGAAARLAISIRAEDGVGNPTTIRRTLRLEP